MRAAHDHSAWWLEGARPYQTKVPGHVSFPQITVCGSKDERRLVSFSVNASRRSACDRRRANLPDASRANKPSGHGFKHDDRLI